VGDQHELAVVGQAHLDPGRKLGSALVPLVLGHAAEPRAHPVRVERFLTGCRHRRPVVQHGVHGRRRSAQLAEHRGRLHRGPSRTVPHLHGPLAPQPRTQQPARDLEAAVEAALELGAHLADYQPQDDVRTLIDPAGHIFDLWQSDRAGLSRRQALSSAHASFTVARLGGR
jgi:Glyoxalase-like domain